MRSILRDEEPWFVAKDACDILGLGNPSQACTNLDEDEKGIINTDTPDGKQEMLIISESGLYGMDDPAIYNKRKDVWSDYNIKWRLIIIIDEIRLHLGLIFMEYGTEYNLPGDFSL